MSQGQDAAPVSSPDPWTSAHRELGDVARWALTAVCCLAVAVSVLGAAFLMSLTMAAVSTIISCGLWLALAIVVTGYRPATPAQVEALPGMTLWHVTHSRAWRPQVKAGDVITLTPSRCRPWSRMHHYSLRPRFPRRAIYITRRHPSLMPRWGLPSRPRDTTLTLELADPTPPAGVFARVDGAIALTEETRMRVVAVNVKEQS